MGTIYFIEKNVHGAWTIYGALGVAQYYDCTKAQAIAKYKEACKKKLFFNEGGKEK